MADALELVLQLVVSRLTYPGCWEPNLDRLEEQQVPLATKASFQLDPQIILHIAAQSNSPQNA